MRGHQKDSNPTFLGRIVGQTKDEKSHPFIIVDHRNGTPLENIQVPMPFRQAHQLVEQLGQVVEYMHNDLNLAFAPPRSIPFKSDPFIRFRRLFVIDPNGQIVLIDYAAWERIPEDTKTRQKQIESDLSLLTVMLNWLLLGKYPKGSVEKLLENVFRLGKQAGLRIPWNKMPREVRETGMIFVELGETLYKETVPEQSSRTAPLPQVVPSSAMSQATRRLSLELATAGVTDKGRVRDHNEDNMLKLLQPGGGLFVVADGMGGHAAGEVASEIAIAELGASSTAQWNQVRGASSPEQVRQIFKNWIKQANDRILAEARARNNNMGTTLTGALVLDQKLYAANVGDSRTYVMRGNELVQITRDHSLVASLVQAGLLRPDQVFDHPQRNEVFRSLGHQEDVEIDVFDPVDLQAEDRILLCSDGLWEMVRPPQLQGILTRNPNPDQACAQLVSQANANGGEDNITAILVRVAQS
ncbi:MAG: Stp1/IreP family PP2C-type Ser/Thr phosphatase [Anaerolineae bacterium]